MDDESVMLESKKKIIIVEDSPTVRFEVKLLLKQIGIIPVEVGGEIGLFMKVEEYGKLADLIIMDLTLKSESGFELIAKLKDDERYSNIPIIVLTEHADAKNVIRAKELGVDDYIRKPINRNSFLEKIEEAISRNKDIL